jgi:hypothetical protein
VLLGPDGRSGRGTGMCLGDRRSKRRLWAQAQKRRGRIPRRAGGALLLLLMPRLFLQFSAPGYAAI